MPEITINYEEKDTVPQKAGAEEAANRIDVRLAEYGPKLQRFLDDPGLDSKWLDRAIPTDSVFTERENFAPPAGLSFDQWERELMKIFEEWSYLRPVAQRFGLTLKEMRGKLEPFLPFLKSRRNPGKFAQWRRVS